MSEAGKGGNGVVDGQVEHWQASFRKEGGCSESSIKATEFETSSGVIYCIYGGGDCVLNFESTSSIYEDLSRNADHATIEAVVINKD